MLETLLTVWIYSPVYWLIAGVVLVGLELADGSMIFFLPLGAGCFGNALLNYLAKTGLSPFSNWMTGSWYVQLVTLAIMALAASYALRVYSRKFSRDDGDINDY